MSPLTAPELPIHRYPIQSVLAKVMIAGWPYTPLLLGCLLAPRSAT